MRSRVAALLVGATLASLPYLIYGASGHTHGPHTDHDPRHGGFLFMVGDHHVEVVHREKTIEIFLSDEVRRPERPTAGWLTLRSGSRVAMRWQGQRLVGSFSDDDRVARYEVWTADGSVLPIPAH